jgi:hypothetical protein
MKKHPPLTPRLPQMLLPRKYLQKKHLPKKQ